ncbi:hypothetical protein [Ignicoccus hospitalis]|uniref:Uncharacterized protein n=1 Tax=Ignicoccus hospitalis (strain KIN4/I / DSM 18386 / JCM 14125) TaxID=453591 RepID=A8AC39_IGNH4|nr:hypothetical protein [Ignicoccus hospitalis]ABU82491.1 hypothetical protein Igni_1315 [Ignicoccus hospitalis KIN4/I]HIH90588.1 hypothetical protein [Desulfurococcaceae archaeon]
MRLLPLALTLLALAATLEGCATVKTEVEGATVKFLVAALCEGEYRLKVEVSGASVSAASGFREVAGGTAEWEGLLRPGEVKALYLTLSHVGPETGVEYELSYEGRAAASGTVGLGRCLSATARAQALEEQIKGVESGYGELSLAVRNACDEEVEGSAIVKFLYANPSPKAYVEYCSEGRTEVYRVPSCAEAGEGPLLACRTWGVGEFKVTELTESIYVEKGTSRAARRLEEVLERVPKCLEWTCYRWISVPRTFSYCAVMKNSGLKSDGHVVGKAVVFKFRLGPHESKVVKTYFSNVTPAFYLGFLEDRAKVPLAVVKVGDEELTIPWYAPNAAYPLTVAVYALALVLMVLALVRLFS